MMNQKWLFADEMTFPSLVERHRIVEHLDYLQGMM